MECLAVMAASVGIIFVRLAMMQELNPLLWGILAIGVYTGAPLVMIWRGATWYEAPWVWASSFIGLLLLFILQSFVAERQRFRNRGGADSSKKRKKGKGKK